MLDTLIKIGNGIRIGFSVLFVVSGLYVPFAEETDESIVSIILAVIICFVLAYVVLPKHHKNKIKGFVFRNNRKESENEVFEGNYTESVPVFDNSEEPELQINNVEELGESSNVASFIPATDEWTNLNGLEFDNQVAKLLATKGFSQVRLTLNSIDQGTDILGEKNGITYYFRCQSSPELVGSQIIRDILAGNSEHNALKLVAVTNNSFTNDAKELAAGANVMLWNRESLSEL